MRWHIVVTWGVWACVDPFPTAVVEITVSHVDATRVATLGFGLGTCLKYFPPKCFQVKYW